MHDAFTIGVPVLAILVTILFNHSDLRDLRVELRWELKELRGEMNRRFAAVDARMDLVDAERGYSLGANGMMDGRIQSLEGR